ncbi:NAD(P)/FAD-dependent oxidoreductase [Rhizobium alvei]|uniref:FAD-dependent oxidoreductase n=1 Tax=Rhizobium alvei TaxID=1132659 RepID=A0ABT8YIK4_9HYPH|nr:FAD-dependent oxidoreductase [Rhizobium alvei]MDO6963525.1 FAD-dependent oxidoreductase [Rhizobium alvei]
MQQTFAIVGRGMMGAAAARHLAESGASVVLIGPDEPVERQHHQGVFASHYDEGRITRTIDPDETWARLANRSIARYRDIEARSGISFFGEKGALISGLTTGRSQQYVANIRDAARRLNAVTSDLDDRGLADIFPYFRFPEGSDAVFEPQSAGYISPRRLVAAQSILAEKAGARIVSDYAVGLKARPSGVTVETSAGELIEVDRVLLAAGGFTNRPGLLPEPLDLKVYGRTVVFFEVDEAEADRLSAMPSLIYEPEDIMAGIYMLPPIRYPDGRIYLKIGGDPTDIPLETDKDRRDWFRTDGDPAARDHLIANMGDLVPGLAVRSISSTSCVTSYTPTGYPAIGWTSEARIGVLTGGCGAAAKSSDEIGRLGAELLLHGRIVDEAYQADFAPRFV